MTTPFTPFLIAPSRTGIDQSVAIPWLTPEDSWQDLQDCYLYLGQLSKRDGYEWFDSVPHAIDGGAGHHYQNIASITNTINATVSMTAAHGLTTGDVIRLTDVLGLTKTIDSALTNINGTRWTVTVTSSTDFTINNTAVFTGTYTANSGTVSKMPWPATTYTGSKVVAIANWIDGSGNPVLMVLDTRRASYFDTTATNNCLVPIGYQDQFSGSTNLFWWENYTSSGFSVVAPSNPTIYFTNNIGMWYWDGTQQATGLTVFAPVYDASNTISTCLMIKNIGNRLVLFNTLENNVRFPKRARFCQELANPTLQAASQSWDSRSTAVGKGGADDVPQAVYLISLGQIQTNLILCSRGLQIGAFIEMRPTGNSNVPFTYTQISNSRNVNSTFGTITLDRQITTVGDDGLITCDGNSAGRYDQKIPQFVINKVDQEGFQNCSAVRNDKKWQSWLAYTSNGSTQNDNVLVFNYQDRSFFNYRISMACLGNFYWQNPDMVWGSFPLDEDWADQDDATWEDFSQKQSITLSGGDYNGNIWLLDEAESGADGEGNFKYGQTSSPGAQIIMEATSRQWFPFAGKAESAQWGMVDLEIDFNENTTVSVDFSVDNNPPYLTQNFSCFPMDAISFGPINYITNANPAKVNSQVHNLVTGETVYPWGVQGMSEVNGTAYAITVLDQDNFTLNVNSTSFGTYTSGGVWTTRNISGSPFFTRLCPSQIGALHQMKITVPGIDCPFTLSAVMVHMKATGRMYRG